MTNKDNAQDKALVKAPLPTTTGPNHQAPPPAAAPSPSSSTMISITESSPVFLMKKKTTTTTSEIDTDVEDFSTVDSSSNTNTTKEVVEDVVDKVDVVDPTTQENKESLKKKNETSLRHERSSPVEDDDDDDGDSTIVSEPSVLPGAVPIAGPGNSSRRSRRTTTAIDMDGMLAHSPEIIEELMGAVQDGRDGDVVTDLEGGGGGNDDARSDSTPVALEAELSPNHGDIENRFNQRLQQIQNQLSLLGFGGGGGNCNGNGGSSRDENSNHHVQEAIIVKQPDLLFSNNRIMRISLLILAALLVLIGIGITVPTVVLSEKKDADSSVAASNNVFDSPSSNNGESILHQGPGSAGGIKHDVHPHDFDTWNCTSTLRCGTDWNNANSYCGPTCERWTEENANTYEPVCAKYGLACFADLTLSPIIPDGKTQDDSKVGVQVCDSLVRCGTDFADANRNCGQSCEQWGEDGIDPCLESGLSCFGGLTFNPPLPSDAYGDEDGTLDLCTSTIRCGTDWDNANSYCGPECERWTEENAATFIPVCADYGLACFADLTLRPPLPTAEDVDGELDGVANGGGEGDNTTNQEVADDGKSRCESTIRCGADWDHANGHCGPTCERWAEENAATFVPVCAEYGLACFADLTLTPDVIPGDARDKEG